MPVTSVDMIDAPADARDAGWLRAARLALWLAWASLAWMTVEGVIWRFTGSRTLSDSAERRAQRAVAVSFWLLAPYVAVESVRDLLGQHRPETTLLGIALTLSSLVLMPALGIAKRRLGARLGSGATAGEGGQNLLCAYLAAAALAGLVANTLWAWWWVDPVAGLVVAGMAVREGIQAWRRESCCDVPMPGAACADDCCAD